MSKKAKIVKVEVNPLPKNIEPLRTNPTAPRDKFTPSGKGAGRPHDLDNQIPVAPRDTLDASVNPREEIRKIWRPLYDLGLKGAEQIDGHYMGILVSAAVTETQDLITNQVVAELEGLLISKPGIGPNGEDMGINLPDHNAIWDTITNRLAQLRKAK